MDGAQDGVAELELGLLTRLGLFGTALLPELRVHIWHKLHVLNL